jgi:hypothetical protein
VARILALRGTPIDDEYARRLGAAIGGPRGCSHVLTLSQLLGSTVRRALASYQPAARDTGEVIFRRDIVLDGHETADRHIEVALQLNDMRSAAAARPVRPMARFGEQYEARLLARVDLESLLLARLGAAERRRTADALDDLPWARREDLGAALVGRPAMRGLSPILLERAAAAPADAPLYDALLMLPPTMIQCFAAFSDNWLRSAAASESLIGMGGMPDSCYMWRRDGALHRARRPDDPVPNI